MKYFLPLFITLSVLACQKKADPTPTGEALVVGSWKIDSVQTEEKIEIYSDPTNSKNNAKKYTWIPNGTKTNRFNTDGTFSLRYNNGSSILGGYVINKSIPRSESKMLLIFKIESQQNSTIGMQGDIYSEGNEKFNKLLLTYRLHEASGTTLFSETHTIYMTRN